MTTKNSCLNKAPREKQIFHSQAKLIYFLSLFFDELHHKISLRPHKKTHRELTEGMSEVLKLIIFVGLEHFLLLLAWLIHKGIQDRPRSVRIALARADYESKQALKREVS